MFETWLPVPVEPFEAVYTVSNLGRICRPEIPVPDSHFIADGTAPGRVLSTCITRKGYRSVTLHANGTRKTVLVYRLVARAFHGPKPGDGYVVAHCDGSSTNDRADNLRWATHAENMQDMIAHGRSLRGNHPGAKFTADEIREIRELQGAVGARELGRQLGVWHSTILRIWSGERWGWLS